VSGSLMGARAGGHLRFGTMEPLPRRHIRRNSMVRWPVFDSIAKAPAHDLRGIKSAPGQALPARRPRRVRRGESQTPAARGGRCRTTE